jgi:hypothetical protein
LGRFPCQQGPPHPRKSGWRHRGHQLQFRDWQRIAAEDAENSSVPKKGETLGRPR